jgi:urease accessory protein
MLKAAEIITELPMGARVEDTLTLPFELRQKSRLLATLDSGRQIALALPRGHVLRNGALLLASDGAAIEIRSAKEELSVVDSPDPSALIRVAYHLGNRHVALQIEPRGLAYLHDHVLDDMVRGLGLAPRVEERPFEPESGAYGRSGSHSHAPHDAHDHHH